MRWFLGVVVALLLSTSMARAESPPLIQQFHVPPLTAKPVGGTLPRPVLFVRVAETNTTDNELSATAFYVYDPAAPKAGLRKVFHGPTEDQYCEILTPLFNGSAIALGHIDAKNRPDSRRTMFWFNLLSGQIGETITDRSYCEQMIGPEIWFCSEESVQLPNVQEDWPATNINRYNWQTGTLTHFRMGLTDICGLGQFSVLAVRHHKEVVKVNLANGEVQQLGDLPDSRMSKFSLDATNGVYPAGANCHDGIYCIRDFSLYFKQPQKDWRAVIENVHILKTFGGKPPHLPVAYVGRGRFAVAKTTKDRAEVSKEREGDFDGTPGLSVTMLIDGPTGKVLKETEPRLYDHNPPLNILDDWWSPDAKPPVLKKQKPGPSCFNRNADGNAIRYAGGKSIAIAKDEKETESQDGRYLAVYRQSTKAKVASSKTIFRMVDGKTGDIVECLITADSHEIYILTAAWQVLCSARPDKATLDAFQKASDVDFFRDPMGNW
jgi:hypothetical protein